MAFAGFPGEGLRFLEQLEQNNERAWFQAHRREYEDGLLEPARDFVAALGEELADVDPPVHADPRVGGSIMRINRDTRFSRDKRPYKNHLDLWFWQGDRPSRESPGFWFRLTPRRLILGAGMHRFEGALLERYREAVADDGSGRELVRALERVDAAGPYELGGSHYKRVPAGYPRDHERADLLLHNGLFVGLEQPVPDLVHTPRFAAFCAGRFREMLPVLEWLVPLTSA